MRRVRVEKKLSQENLAHLLDITQSSYAKIERGATHMTIETLLRICHHLAVNPADVITNSYKAQNSDRVNDTVNKLLAIPGTQDKTNYDLKRIITELKEISERSI